MAARKVAINGFGRIGRLVLRVGIDRPNLEFVAVNDLGDPETLAYLFELDSVHGPFNGSVEVRDSTLRINGHDVEILAEKDPGKLPWREMGVDLVIESTGRFESKQKSLLHVEQAGAKQVLITAPADGVDTTIAYGVNDDIYNADRDKIISIGSCTTNALAPVAKVLSQRFGIRKGFINTTHSYTNSQALLDSAKGKLTRSRAAAVNLVPTSTGAAKAIHEILPELEGKLDGLAVRVPTPCGSILDFTAVLEREVTVEDINSAMSEACSDQRYRGVMQVASRPLVSSDVINNPHTSVVDGTLTMAMGDLAKVMAWYDNEYGFSCRVVDVALMMTSQVRQPVLAA